MKDINGVEIKPGDTLYNSWDRDGYHKVLVDLSGNLFLGDFDSPLERYSPEKFWSVCSREDTPGATEPQANAG